MALPKTGVQLVADGADTFNKAMEAATASVDSFGKSASGAAAQGVSTFGKALDAGIGFVSNLGGSLKSTLGIFGGFGSGVASILNTLGSLFDRVFNQILRVTLRTIIRDVENFIGSMVSASIAGTQLEKDLGRLDESLKEVSKASFAPLVSELGSLVEKAAPSFLGVVQAAETYLGGIGKNALVWGENVVNQFAQGMFDAIGSILSALTSIANLVSYYLSPGSPPRLLPDIDKWGTAAANEFFGGWAKADFTVFNDLSSTLTSLIQSLPTGNKDTSVIPRILGAREDLAGAVEELRATGSITSATMDKITAAVGTSDASVRAYLESMVRLQAANQGVKDAQDNLNKVTQTYNDLLKPVDAAIAGITEAQQELADQQKKSLLELVLKDPNATANDKRAAQLGIEKIDAEQRRRLLLADQKTAVDAAQAKLDAAKTVQSTAQDEYDARLAQIKVITDTNSLLKQQLQLLESLNKAAAAGPKGGAGAPAPFAIKPFDLSKLVPPDLLKKWDAFTAAFGQMWDRIVAKFQPTIDAINSKLIPAFDNLLQAVQNRLPKIEDEFAKTFAFMVSQSALAGPTIVTNMADALNHLADIIKGHGDTIISIFGFLSRAIFTIFTLMITDISASVSIWLNALSTILDVFSLGFQLKWSEMGTRVLLGFSEFMLTIISTAQTDLDLVAQLFGTSWAAISKGLQTTWDYISAYAKIAFDSIQSTIVTISGTVTAAINSILWAAVSLYDWLATHVFNFKLNLPELPKWATPGSPTPFEIGLRGMSDALKGVANDMYSLRSAATAMGTVAPVVTSSTYNNTTQFVYSPTYHSAPSPVSDNFATLAAMWS